jgi:hypothetical protein
MVQYSAKQANAHKQAHGLWLPIRARFICGRSQPCTLFTHGFGRCAATIPTEPPTSEPPNPNLVTSAEPKPCKEITVRTDSACDDFIESERVWLEGVLCAPGERECSELQHDLGGMAAVSSLCTTCMLLLLLALHIQPSYVRARSSCRFSLETVPPTHILVSVPQSLGACLGG